MSALFALLDDIAVIAKMSAVALDDVATQSLKAAGKASGIVIDDTATTPQYVTGLTPDREVPIVWRIAKGSLKNKAIISTVLFGLGLGLSLVGIPVLTVATPFLMAGGVYLAYEGYEKLFVHHHQSSETVNETQQLYAEDARVIDAVRTDMILSAEILALTFAGQSEATPYMQAGVLVITSLLMTIGVYGVVAALIKADDLGLHMARTKTLPHILNPMGRYLVKAMPYVFTSLGYGGAAAMLWVGGSMVIHGLAYFGIDAPEHAIHTAAHALHFGGIFAWLVTAALSAVVGIALGAIALKAMGATQRFRKS